MLSCPNDTWRLFHDALDRTLRYSQNDNSSLYSRCKSLPENYLSHIGKVLSNLAVITEHDSQRKTVYAYIKNTAAPSSLPLASPPALQSRAVCLFE